jgi:SPP1 gp7 family putative phage head morphogenesis protein
MADFLFDPVPAETAIAFVKRRLPMKRATYEGLLPELQGAAFTVAGIERLDVLQQLLDMVAEVPAGEDFDQVKKRVKQILLDHIAPPRDAEPALFADFTAEELAEHARKLDNRAKFITRTLTTKAYAHTAYADLQAAGDALPYWQYLTVGDEHVRDSHRALDGVILPKDDPFWQKHFPPWEFGCRCQVVGVPAPEVEEMRAAEAGKPDEEKLVLTPEQIERLHNENRLWRVVGGNKMDAILTPPDEKGKCIAWRFDPADLRPNLGELKARYRPEVWRAWQKWAKATPVDPLGTDGRTVWDWASAKQPRPKRERKPAPKARAASLTEVLVRAGISRTGPATLGKIQALRAALKHQSPTSIDGSLRGVKVEGGQHARSLEASWKAHVNDWLQYVDPDLIKALPQLEVVITARLNALGQYSPVARKVTLNADYLAPGQMSRDTVWHEFTHWLHMHAPPAKRQALADWFAAQTKGQQLVKLRDGGDGIPDDLLTPARGDYAGRIYPFERGGPQGLEVPTTRMEVLSRSDEELLDHWNFISPTTGRYAWRESFLQTLELLFQ